jgi:subtilisin family serine protease
MSMGRRARRVTFAAVLALNALLLLSIGASSAAVQQKRTAPPSATRVTLVTGDIVQVNRRSGKTSVAVDSASGDAFQVYTDADGDTFVVPQRLAPYLRSGSLDRDLFNVTGLIEQGYDDAHTNRLPLIVTYEGQATRSAVASRSAALPASDRSLVLESIDGAAVSVAKPSADTFWAAVDGIARTGDLGAGIDEIDLDGRATASLDESVPLIGAPTAWANGLDGAGIDVAVLDTGIDGNHPDLQGKVVAEANFTPEASAADGFGHGTHVAATVAGDGDASGGLRKGVATGASLLNGKVLDNNGSGFDSWIIAGMEWAIANGAEVVNMSLGGFPSDGSDPLSQAVNQLTASSGTLFVISAGNFGPSSYSVTNPGTADAALTVGNVTKAEELAFDSGRGPRVGNHAIKPDITAPGSSIVAARAAGTSLGQPVDAFYTRLSGTSMAAPHVAGSAAILLEQHPDWSPAQLKSALVSTAKPRPGLTVYEQGGGRVDVARVVTQGVFAGPTPLDFGFFRYPQTDVQPVTRTVTLTNDTAAAVTLDVSVSANDERGAPAAPGMVTVGQPSVSVPANGTASVHVTVDARLGGFGLYSGSFVAQSASGVRVSLPLGFNKEPESYDLQITALDRFGNPNRGATVQVANVEDSSKFFTFPNFDFNGQATLRVPPGPYSVVGVVSTNEGDEISYSFVGDPEVVVGPGGASVVLDGRRAVPADYRVERESEAISAKLEWWRQPLAGETVSFRFLLGEPFTSMYANPTDGDVTTGDFHLVTQKSLVEPDLEVSAPGLSEFRPNYFFQSPELPDGRFHYEVVDARTGTPDDFARVDAQGKIAVIDSANESWSELIRRAAADGAVMALLWQDTGFPLSGAVELGLPIPGAALQVSQAHTLLSWLDRGGEQLDVNSRPNSDFIYDLRFDEDGGVPDQLRYHVDDRDLARVESSFHSDAPGRTAGEVRAGFAPWQDFSFDSAIFLGIPHERVEYVTAREGLLWLHQVWGYWTNEVPFGHQMNDQFRHFEPGDRLSHSWFEAPLPSEPREELTDQNRVAIECPACRDADELFFWIQDFGDSAEGHYGFFDTRWENSATRLFRNGELVVSRRTGRGVLPAVSEPADYRLEIDSFAAAPWTVQTNANTVWSFRSGAPTANGNLPPWYACATGRGRECAFLPLLFLDYDLGLDLLNQARAGKTHVIGIEVGAQPFAPDPDVRSLSVEASYDDGATWQPAQVRRSGRNRYTATLRHPSDAAYVSLRVEAEAAGGSAVSQELIRAYRVG